MASERQELSCQKFEPVEKRLARFAERTQFFIRGNDLLELVVSTRVGSKLSAENGQRITVLSYNPRRAASAASAIRLKTFNIASHSPGFKVARSLAWARVHPGLVAARIFFPAAVSR